MNNRIGQNEDDTSILVLFISQRLLIPLIIYPTGSIQGVGNGGHNVAMVPFASGLDLVDVERRDLFSPHSVNFYLKILGNIIPG